MNGTSGKRRNFTDSVQSLVLWCRCDTTGRPTVLTLFCPYCGTQLADDLECLGPGQPDTLGCENPGCGQRFAYLIRECLKCGEESVFSWRVMPKPAEMSGLSCQHCGAVLNEADRET